MHRKQTFFRSLLLSGGLLAASAAGAYAQTPTGTISGTVLDSSGASVANATVTVTNSATNVSQTLKTDSGGRYTQANLTPGQYQVKVVAPGFTAAEQENVTVDIAQTHPADFSLAVGSDNASVTVEATTPALETDNAATGQVITGKRILDLPLNGRDPFDLATLVPGVNNVGTGPGSSSTPHIAGSRNANSEEELDGITNITPENNVGNNSGAYTPIVDSVSEFNVQTSVLPAEYGRFSGGVINLATRTGTNGLHGSIFEFNRNSVFDARDYFSAPGSPIAPLSRNQAGATAGGPLIKDRTFFFVAAEISREVDSTTETDSVATQAERTGDFSALLSQVDSSGKPAPIQLYNPSSGHLGTYTNGTGQQVTGFLRDPFPGNIIPSGQLNAVGVAALKYQPLPNVNTTSLFNNYVVTGGSPDTNYYHYDIRVDHSWTPSWKTFVRFSHFAEQQTPFADYPANNAVASQGYSGPFHTGSYSLAYDNTFTLSPSLVFDVRYGLSRSEFKRIPLGGAFDITSLGLPGSLATTSNAQVFPTFTIGNGYSSLGSGGYVDYQENPTVHDLLADFDKLKGAHDLKFGGEYRKLFLNFYQYGYPSGQFNFSQDWTQHVAGDASVVGGNPFASMLLGLPDGGQYTIDPSLAVAGAYYALYAEDTWRVTNHFTLSYGLRWDVDQPRTDRHNQLSYFNPNDVGPIASVTPAPGVTCVACGNLRGAEHFVGTSTGQFGRQQIAAHKLDFGPRFGAIWSPDQNWAVRAGFGIVYAPSTVQPAGSDGGAGTEGFNTQSFPSFSFDSQKTIATTLSNPFPAGVQIPAGAAGGLGNNLGAAIQSDYITENDTRTPYSEQANLTIQRTLPGQTVVEVGWLFNQGKFLIDGNPQGVPRDQVDPSFLSLGSGLQAQVANPFYGKITTPNSPLSQPMIQANYLLRPYPQYNGVSEYRKDTALSNYNAVTLRLDKRFAQGLTLLVAYTGAKLFDNSAAAVTFLGPTSSTYANQYNPAGEYSVSPQDISHDLVTSYTYELPFGPGRHYLSNLHGIAGTLVSGFQSSGIVNWIGGTPIVLGGVGDTTFLLANSQRPNMSNFNAKLNNPTRQEWFNTSVFSLPANYTFGNAPRTLANVRTPQLVSADLSAIKNNYFGADKRYNLQLRLEAFNALNHVQLGAPDAGQQDGSNFGKITGTANGPRQVQLAAKFNF